MNSIFKQGTMDAISITTDSNPGIIVLMLSLFCILILLVLILKVLYSLRSWIKDPYNHDHVINKLLEENILRVLREKILGLKKREKPRLELVE
ncbi:MAG: hypothetical protein HOE90_13295 [Bacteriovoracaceae bacterium]|jgi:hypothetical protein|nr:hypothetical protein [Bacteriovoracaceae bacterium]